MVDPMMEIGRIRVEVWSKGSITLEKESGSVGRGSNPRIGERRNPMR